MERKIFLYIKSLPSGWGCWWNVASSHSGVGGVWSEPQRWLRIGVDKVESKITNQQAEEICWVWRFSKCYHLSNRLDVHLFDMYSGGLGICYLTITPQSEAMVRFLRCLIMRSFVQVSSSQPFISLDGGWTQKGSFGDGNRQSLGTSEAGNLFLACRCYKKAMHVNPFSN